MELYLSSKSSLEMAEELRQRYTKQDFKKCRRQFTEKCKTTRMNDHLDELREHYVQIKKDHQLAFLPLNRSAGQSCRFFL